MLVLTTLQQTSSVPLFLWWKKIKRSVFLGEKERGKWSGLGGGES